MKFLSCALLGFVALNVFAETCVDELKYPETLASEYEYWATPSLVFNGSAEAECNLTKKLVASFLGMQDAIKNATPGKKALRGTHAKGICATGSFESALGSDLSPEQKTALLKTGLFSTPGTLPATFRFANGASRILPDWKPDVRALSMKIALPSGATQDFAFNNVPRFQIDTLDNFVELMAMQIGLMTGQIEVDAQGTPSKISLFNFFRERSGVNKAAVTLRALKSIKERASEDTKYHASLTDQNYWSTTAFAVGSPQSVAKFGATPCVNAQTSGQPLHSSQLTRVELASEDNAKKFAEGLVESGLVMNAENYLSESLVSTLMQAPVCYNLFVQFLDEEDSVQTRQGSGKLVEDPSIIWNGPVHIIGRIQISEPVDAIACDNPETNNVNVMENSPAIIGLGQLNRARQFAETASWKNRR